MRSIVSLIVVSLIVAITFALMSLSGCKAKDSRAKAGDAAVPPPPAPRAPATNTTVNAFLAQGIPTFVMGTEGDKLADRSIAAQVAIARNVVAPSAVMLDTVIKPGDRSTWPKLPILYGGSSFNGVIDNLGELPFAVSPGKLTIGGKEFVGPGFQLITVVPEQAAHPEFLFYAGTGSPGVAEINGVPHGGNAILIADAFGPLHTGEWIYDQAGQLRAKLSEASRRVEWREVKGATASVFFVADLEPGTDEAMTIASCEQSVAMARKKLGIEDAPPISIYVSPDAKSKVLLTGRGGDGHAVPEFGAIHVVGIAGDALRHLVAHEATHVLAHAAFGQAGTALVGEGLAVWVSGEYAGTKIGDFAKEVGTPRIINELLGPLFPRLPEPEAYMRAGLVVEAAVKEVGIQEVGDHLLGATRDTWESECKRAGTTMGAMQERYVAEFSLPKKKQKKR